MASAIVDKIPAVLALGGAFNPIHTQHIETIKIAKEYIEANSDFIIIEGFLAPAPAGYVKNKMKKNDLVIQSECRIKMCNKAIEGFEWMKPISSTYGSASNCAERCKSCQDYKTIIVVGADRAITKRNVKWRQNRKDHDYTVFIGRPGDTDNVRESWENDLKNGLVFGDNKYYFANAETLDVSSTKIREKLSIIQKLSLKDDKKAILNDLVFKNYLHQSVANYILEHEDVLYEN